MRNTKKKTLEVLVTPQLFDITKRYAEASGRTLSEYVRQAIEYKNEKWAEPRYHFMKQGRPYRGSREPPADESRNIAEYVRAYSDSDTSGEHSSQNGE